MTEQNTDWRTLCNTDTSDEDAFFATVSARAEAVEREAITNCSGLTVSADNPRIVAGVAALYREYGLRAGEPEGYPPPQRIVLYPDLASLRRACRETEGTDSVVTLADCGLGAVHYMQWLDYALAIDAVLPGERVGNDAEIAHVRAMAEITLLIFDGALYDEEARLVVQPAEVHRDADGNLHREDGPAARWSTPGSEQYYWHGQAIDAHVITAPDTVTRDYLTNLPAERRRASYEALGHERVVAILGLTPTDSCTVDGLHYELYHGAGDAWLRMQSPPRKDGSQPYYVEPVHEDCTTVAQARGWRVSGEVGDTVEFEIET